MTELNIAADPSPPDCPLAVAHLSAADAGALPWIRSIRAARSLA